MKYFGIIEHEDDKQPLHICDTDFGMSIDQLEEGLDLSCSKVEKKVLNISDDVDIMDWQSVVLPLVSKKFLNVVLSTNCIGLQYFPVDLVKGKKTYEYFCLNYIPVLTGAVDKSESAILPGVINDYYASPAIIESKINSLDIFRTKETDKRIVVSQRLQVMLKKEKVTGVDFLQYKTSSKENVKIK